MTLKKLYSRLKRNGLNFLFAGFLILVIFSTATKSWLLKQLVSIGLFNAEITNNTANENLPEIVPFTVISTEGKIQNTAALKGKIVFINFWASWCPPCRAEMSSINELYKKLKNDERFVFILVNEDDDKAKAAEYMESNHFIVPIYNRQGNVANEVFNGTLPTTIVINKEGKVVLKHEGIGGYDTEAFLQQLKKLL